MAIKVSPKKTNERQGAEKALQPHHTELYNKVFGNWDGSSPFKTPLQASKVKQAIASLDRAQTKYIDSLFYQPVMYQKNKEKLVGPALKYIERIGELTRGMPKAQMSLLMSGAYKHKSIRQIKESIESTRGLSQDQLKFLEQVKAPRHYALDLFAKKIRAIGPKHVGGARAAISLGYDMADPQFGRKAQELSANHTKKIMALKKRPPTKDVFYYKDATNHIEMLHKAVGHK